jgi:hypothetical protein
LTVNGKKMETGRQLTGMIADVHVGDNAAIRVLRDGKAKPFSVKVAKREDEPMASHRPKRSTEDELGLEVATLDAEMARQFKVKEAGGVIVVRGSAAARRIGRCDTRGRYSGDQPPGDSFNGQLREGDFRNPRAKRHEFFQRQIHQGFIS